MIPGGDGGRRTMMTDNQTRAQMAKEARARRKATSRDEYEMLMDAQDAAQETKGARDDV